MKVIKRRSTIRRSALPSTFPGFLAFRFFFTAACFYRSANQIPFSASFG
jgi:hypothetical protein